MLQVSYCALPSASTLVTVFHIIFTVMPAKGGHNPHFTLNLSRKKEREERKTERKEERKRRGGEGRGEEGRRGKEER